MRVARRCRIVAALIALALFPVGLLLAGCRTPDSSAAAATRTKGPDAYESSGRVGDLRIHLPPATTMRPFPLVIALHSLYHDGANAKKYFGLDAASDRFGFAVAYPDGKDLSWNAGSCCYLSADNEVDDVAYIRAVISHIEQRYPIDRRRVVLVGLSNGGMLAYRYACAYPGELAGIGVVSGSLQIAGCRPAVPVSVVSVHGMHDDLVPYGGEAWSRDLNTPVTSTEASLAPFRQLDRCPKPSPQRDSVVTDSTGVPVAPGAPAPSGAIALKVEAPCLSDARVVEFVMPELGHGWPSLAGRNYFDTAGAIWGILDDARSAKIGPDL